MSKRLNGIKIAEALSVNMEHSRRLGLRVVEIEAGRLVLELPFSEAIVGDPRRGVIHGGALATLLDTCCGFAVVSSLEDPAVCPTLDLRIDYMRAAETNKSVFAECRVIRSTKSVIFARGVAYQDSIDKPVAHVAATFMSLDQQVNEGMQEQMIETLRAMGADV